MTYYVTYLVENLIFDRPSKVCRPTLLEIFGLMVRRTIGFSDWGAFWRPIDQDQVLTTWSEGRQNGLVLNLRSCDVTALQSSKSDINIQ